MIDGPSKEIATSLDMVVSRCLARDDTLIVNLVGFVLGESLEKQLPKVFKGYLELCEIASRDLQFGQQVTPRATDDGKQYRILE